MKVGFTGTRRGMTTAQRDTVRALLKASNPIEVYHGDCIGSDEQFAELCSKLEPRPKIIAFPGKSAKGPEEHEFRAHSPHNDLTHPSESHFARNRRIVDLSVILIATPAEPEHQNRGGTWYTIDYAGKEGVVTYVVKPDGTVSS